MDCFWSPDFTCEHRAGGTVIMAQTGALPDHPQILAQYLDHWAEVAPDRTWIARRSDTGDWIRITYAQAQTAARALGAGLLALDLGPDRPLLILS